MNMSGDISSLPPTLSRTLTLHHHQHRVAEQLSADSFFCTFTQWICIFRTFCRKLCDVFSGNIACLHNMSRSRPVSKSTEVFLINSLPCWLNCRGLISLWHFYDKKISSQTLPSFRVAIPEINNSILLFFYRRRRVDAVERDDGSDCDFLWVWNVLTMPLHFFLRATFSHPHLHRQTTCHMCVAVEVKETLVNSLCTEIVAVYVFAYSNTCGEAHFCLHSSSRERVKECRESISFIVKNWKWLNQTHAECVCMFALKLR